jgi:hypothetical protein
VDRTGNITELPKMTKRDLADRILDAILALDGPSSPSLRTHVDS